jgi:hypothetical protein
MQYSTCIVTTLLVSSYPLSKAFVVRLRLHLLLTGPRVIEERRSNNRAGVRPRQAAKDSEGTIFCNAS